MEMKFKWITVKEAVELVLSDKFDNGGSLDFTLDSYEFDHDDPQFTPTGWYGIARTNCSTETLLLLDIMAVELKWS